MQNQFEILQGPGGSGDVTSSQQRKKKKKSRATTDLSTTSLTIETLPKQPGSPFKETASANTSPAYFHRLSDRGAGYHSPTCMSRSPPDTVPNPGTQQPAVAGSDGRRITTQLSSDAVLGSQKFSNSTGSVPIRVASTAVPTGFSAELQTFQQYLSAESHPEQIYPKTDVVWGQTERDKVYNFLLHVPYQLERVMWYGCALCMDSFLACLTITPWRALLALRALLPSPRAPKPRIQGSQLFDLVVCAVLAAATWCLLLLDPGAIYFSIKDIISEFLKIHVVSTALELFDKILSNFGVDALESLSGTCTLWAQGSPQRTTMQLLADILVVFTVTVLHAAVLMCQAILFSVAMTSKNSALLALLIASNFVEIKGTVYKRMDVTKLWAVACMDIVERMHLVVVLAFVVVEDIRSAGAWRLPTPGLLLVCAQVLCGEMVIDVIKHAVLGKFNDIRPGVYREFMKDLSEKNNRSQSYSVHKHLGFHYTASAALVLRMVATLLTLSSGMRLGWAVAALWGALAGAKLGFGYLLKVFGWRYMRYYVQHYGAGRSTRVADTVLGKGKKAS